VLLFKLLHILSSLDPNLIQFPSLQFLVRVLKVLPFVIHLLVDKSVRLLETLPNVLVLYKLIVHLHLDKLLN
jgi:hypothetical protein